jgi:hypothetical protein
MGVEAFTTNRMPEHELSRDAKCIQVVWSKRLEFEPQHVNFMRSFVGKGGAMGVCMSGFKAKESACHMIGLGLIVQAWL